MKLIHLSDLHLGKKFYGYDLCQDQRVIFEQIKEYVVKQEADGVIIAGDIYDTPLPSGEAMDIFEDFLVFLSQLPKKPHIFVIYGNHDSGDRVSFGATLFEKLGLHISPVYEAEMKISPITISDEFGEVDVYLLPFVHPHHVGKDEKGKTWSTYQDAIAHVVSGLDLDKSRRNIMITHQYVDVAGEVKVVETSSSERYIRGGTERIETTVFQDFEYVALGHLHNPQDVGSSRIRYCGSPLPYSLSELKYPKSLTVVDLLEKKNDLELGEIQVKSLLLDRPYRELVVLSGYSDDILKSSAVEVHHNDFVYLKLKDSDKKPWLGAQLRKSFPFFLDYEMVNQKKLGVEHLSQMENVGEEAPIDVCKSFFGQQMAKVKGDSVELATLEEEQIELLHELIAEIWGV